LGNSADTLKHRASTAHLHDGAGYGDSTSNLKSDIIVDPIIYVENPRLEDEDLDSLLE
jgi:hypothetical protein